MPDQATLNHAAQVLAAISGEQRADMALRAYFENHRYLQPPARRHVSRTVFAYFRWLSWLGPKDPPQKRLAGAVALQERFDADPKSIKPETLAVRAVPSWVWDEFDLPDPAAKTAFLRQLQREPALWLRARPGTAAVLAAALGHCELAPPIRVWGSEFGVRRSALPTPNSELRTPNSIADALRYAGPKDLFRTSEFAEGKFEIQDLSSQLVGHACAPQPGETWWDACAGEGGKTLHLADLMQNKGVVWATDRHTGRLETLKRRAARAKLFNYRTAVWDGGPNLPTKTKFDGILVDAPCSGLGTWQRNPHARWTTTPDDVRELAAMQLTLLGRVAGSLKAGGRLVYSVCTLARRETFAVAEAFGHTHPGFEGVSLDDGGQRAEDRPEKSEAEAEIESSPPSALRPLPSAAPPLSSAVRPLSSVLLWPHDLNANGMFIAAWRKK